MLGSVYRYRVDGSTLLWRRRRRSCMELELGESRTIGGHTEEAHASRCHVIGQGRRTRSTHGLWREEWVGYTSRKQRCTDVIISDTVPSLDRNELHTFPLRPRGHVRGRWWLRNGRGGLGRRERLRLRLLATLLADVNCAPAWTCGCIAGYALRRGWWRLDLWWWRGWIVGVLVGDGLGYDDGR